MKKRVIHLLIEEPDWEPNLKEIIIIIAFIVIVFSLAIYLGLNS